MHKRASILSGLLGVCILLAASPAAAQVSDNDAAVARSCELHIWPTANFNGIFFHSGGAVFNGDGAQLDLVSTPVENAARKARAGLDSEMQSKILSDAVRSSGKFDGYEIVVHDPLPQDKAKNYTNLIDKAVGLGKREIPSDAPCYVELHVAYITTFRTHLTKMLMTGFLVRHFPSDPTQDAVRVVNSRPNRGEERYTLANFDFSETKLTSEEQTSLTHSFGFMADRFFRKKVKS